MSNKIVPVNGDAHRTLKVSRSEDFRHASRTHLCRVTANEIGLASMDYPVVLIREPDSDRYHCTALLGFENGENVYHFDGKWHAAYVPSNVAVAPFALGTASADSNTLVPCINEASTYVGTDDGEPLFDDDGKKTDFLNQAEKDLEALYTNEMATQHFVERLKTLDLLHPFSLDVAYADGNRKSMVGMYTVSSEKLEQLPDAEALEFFRNGYLVPIYAMMSSLNQVHRMIEFRNDSGNGAIVGFEYRLQSKG